MNRRDLTFITIIGAAVGLLSQPILGNLAGQFNITVTPGLRLGVFAAFTLFAPFALFVISQLARVISSLYQFGKYAGVGTLNFFVDLGVLNLLIWIFGAPDPAIHVWTYRIFKGVSFLGATTNSFIWNKFWTFDSREPATVRQTVKFYSAAFIGFLLNVGTASYVFSGILPPAGIAPETWANVGALAGVGASFLWNFLAYKYWVFKKA